MKIELQNLQATFKTLEDLDKQKAKEAIRIVTQATYENVLFFAKTHYKTGTLEKNIRHKVKTQAGIVWVADDNMLVDWKRRKINYAEFVLKGTRPHWIHAKNKKALRFSYKNLDEFVFRKSVYHPGYKGDNFIKKAINKTLKDLDKLI